MLEKTNFSFVNGYQLDIDSVFQMGGLYLLPFSVLEPILSYTCVGPVHAATVSVSSYAHQSCCG